MSWEYKETAIKRSPETGGFGQGLNELGKEGWELVHLQIAENRSTGKEIAYCVFKRPVIHPPEFTPITEEELARMASGELGTVVRPGARL